MDDGTMSVPPATDEPVMPTPAEGESEAPAAPAPSEGGDMGMPSEGGDAAPQV